MNDPRLEFEQLLLLLPTTGPEIVARSEGIDFALEESARRIAVSLGSHGSSDIEAVFAIPTDSRRVVVGTLVIKPERPPALQMIFVPRSTYTVIGDPFAIAGRFPVNVEVRGSLPLLVWPDVASPRRSVQDLQRILANQDAPLLLGAAQALLDGVTIRLKRAAPDRTLLRDLWQLLPDSIRAERWPCEYAFSEGLPFHIAVMPELPESLPRGTIDEEQVKDYPDGRYELALQAAVESADQGSLDGLLARAHPRQVLKMAVLMLIFAVVALLMTRRF